MIAWEAIRDAYADVPSTAYFSEILRIAIEEYHDLKGDRLAFGKYADDRLPGSEILKRHEQSDLTFLMMGRKASMDQSLLTILQPESEGAEVVRRAFQLVCSF
jgi:hypothetical protein